MTTLIYEHMLCYIHILTSPNTQHNVEYPQYSAVPTSGAVSTSELPACLLGVTVTSGARIGNTLESLPDRKKQFECSNTIHTNL